MARRDRGCQNQKASPLSFVGLYVPQTGGGGLAGETLSVESIYVVWALVYSKFFKKH